MCDRVAVMYAGEIVEQADVRSLFAHPQHPYTRGLIGSVPVPGDIREELTPVPGSVPNMLSLPAGCRFAPRCVIREAEGNPLALTHHPELRPTSDRHLVRCWRFHRLDGSVRAAEGAWEPAELTAAEGPTPLPALAGAPS
jgi:oligopeptide/dipeptide ABC transporter ATP-binding protein